MHGPDFRLSLAVGAAPMDPYVSHDAAVVNGLESPRPLTGE